MPIRRSHAPRVCDDEGRDPKFHSGIGATIGRQRHSCQRGCAKSGVDALIPSTMPEDAVENFGKNTPMKRPAQPAELATAYVMLADPLSSYVSGATIAVTGGRALLQNISHL